MAASVYTRADFLRDMAESQKRVDARYARADAAQEAREKELEQQAQERRKRKKNQRTRRTNDDEVDSTIGQAAPSEASMPVELSSPSRSGAVASPSFTDDTVASAEQLSPRTQNHSVSASVASRSGAGLFGTEEHPTQLAQRSTRTYTPPRWYLDIKTDSLEMKTLQKKRDGLARQALTALSAMKNCADRCEKASKPAELANLFDELRDHVHKAEFLELNDLIVKKARMLESNGLVRIFATESQAQYPSDLRADAFQLYVRWCTKIFSIDLLRGILPCKSKNKEHARNADRIDPTYQGRASARFYGEGDFVNGQWWPTQLCTVRDGAHGSPQAGIFGEKGKGAYSVVLSGGNHYADEDKGDEIFYCGTDGRERKPTENTLRMLETCETVRQPVRVLRSWNLPKNNQYRPMRGFRYDGLYDVVEAHLLDAEKAIYKFRLVRQPDQPAIRCEENNARRPTQYEVDEYDKLKKEGIGIYEEGC